MHPVMHYTYFTRGSDHKTAKLAIKTMELYSP